MMPPLPHRPYLVGELDNAAGREEEAKERENGKQ